MDDIRLTPETGNYLGARVDTPSGLPAVMRSRAGRIELCKARPEGGLTPSMGFMRLAARLSDHGFKVPVRAAFRPRDNNFTYALDDLEVMRHDIDAVAACGLEGVVLGSNLVSGVLDEAVIGGPARHVQATEPCVALHRGFDLTPIPHAALDYGIDQAINTILISGGQSSAAGFAAPTTMVECEGGRIETLTETGRTVQNTPGVLLSKVTALHASYRSALAGSYDQSTQLGYVTCDRGDTDGALVAHLTKHLRLWNRRMSFTETIGRLAKDDPAPLYLQLQRILRDAIQNRHLHQNDAIPPERDLAEDFDISRITVRKAIDGLVTEGLLTRRRGAGTFVASRVEKSFSKLSSFSEDMISRGRKPHSEWVSKSAGAVTPEESLSLSLSPGATVFRFHRIRYADGMTMALEYSTIPAYCLTSPESVTTSLYEALEKTGHRPIRALQRLRAVAFAPEQAERLGVKPGDPGLFIERRGFLQDGRAAEFTQSYYRGDAYDVVAELNDIS